MSAADPCYHCLLFGHWQASCPLLKLPDDEKDHFRRLAEIKRRFDYEEIGPQAKTRMITKENELWKQK